MKKIILIIIPLILIFLIYDKFNNNSIYFVSIGDEIITNLNNKDIKKYNNDNVSEDYLIKKLTSNIYNNDNSLKKVITSSDILLISIGTTDLINILNNNNNSLSIYKELDDLIKDYENLIKEVNKYARKKVIAIGLYDKQINDKYINYFNNNLYRLLLKYNICFLNFNNYLDKNNIVKHDIIIKYLSNTTCKM